MCGIFAAMTRNGLSTDRCDTALKLLEHRGPDGTGIWTSRDGQWTLGHTRLSIIGLRNGSQPMTSPDGAVHVVVNGEFYGYRELRERLRASGYRFSTDSDSEIAVHLYRERGMQAATQLRGEFAVVIADERQRADDRDPRPLRGQAALLRSGERRRVLRVGDQGVVGAGCAGRVGSRGRYRRHGQIAREDRVRRDQYGAAGLLCDRQRWRCSHLSVLGLGDPDC